MMRGAHLLIVGALAVATSATPALAGTVDVQFVGTGNGRLVGVTLYGDSFDVFAGQLVHNLSNGTGELASLSGDILTYCTELTEHVSSTRTEYYSESLAAAPESRSMGRVKAQAITDMYALADGAQYGDNDTMAAAFQLAIWEVLYDFTGDVASLDLAEGDFTATRPGGSPLYAGVGRRVGHLWGGIGSGAVMPELFAIGGFGGQDQLVVVPLPAPLMLGAAGLAIIAVRRRRTPA